MTRESRLWNAARTARIGFAWGVPFFRALRADETGDREEGALLGI